MNEKIKFNKKRSDKSICDIDINFKKKSLYTSGAGIGNVTGSRREYMLRRNGGRASGIRRNPLLNMGNRGNRNHSLGLNYPRPSAAALNRFPTPPPGTVIHARGSIFANADQPRDPHMYTAGGADGHHA